MEGHICRQNTLMFALVFCFELRARAARTCCHCHLQAAVKNPIHDGKRGQLKLPKKVINGTTMWSCDTELCTNGVEATKCWVFVAHFSIYSTSRCRCHTGTDMNSETPWSHSSNQPGGTYCQAQDFLLRTNYTLEMWCANTKSANQVPTSPVKTLVIPMSWSYRYFEWQER